MPKQTIAVGGGKGGVGKSLVAANLAVTLAQSGRSVVIVDADLGGANLHTLFGIDRPEVLLEHFVAKKVERLEETILSTGIAGLSIICGGMPILGAANPKFAQKMKLIRHILALEFDIIVIDVGAGIGFNVLDMFNAAEIQIIVFTPQLTSLHNGYGFLKAAIHRRLQRLLPTELRDLMLATSPESGAESLADVLVRLAEQDPEETERAKTVLRAQKLFLAGNMIRNAKERHVIGAVGKMVRDHLQLEAPVIATLKYGDKLARSVNERRPFMSWAGIESNAEAFRSMAQKVLALKSEGNAAVSRPRPNDESKRSVGGSPSDRKDPRFPLPSVRVLLTVGDMVLAGYVQNVAYGGIKVEFDQAASTPASGLLRIGPTPDGDTFDVQVEERHRDPSGMLVGFSFHNVDNDARTCIHSLVALAAATTAVRRTPTDGLESSL
ncbi:MAG: P-loop NTPase [Deltaproteobacteria bacterium]|nr:P-loop NTPase [Deltaproteobacteria bacterium]